jgi:hypothetical protein
MEIYKRLLIGIGFIIAGIWAIIYTYKHPNSTFKAHDIGGYMGGITFIVLGVMEIFCGIDITN